MITNKKDTQIHSETTYDPYGKTVKTYIYDKSGHLKSKTVRTYDSDDNICFETTYDANDTKLSETEHLYDNGQKISKTDSKYDEQGRVISSTAYDANDQITMHTQIRYNTLGTKLSEEVHTYLDGQTLFTTKFIYARDGHIVSEVKYSPKGEKLYQCPHSTIINKLAILSSLVETKAKKMIQKKAYRKDGLSWLHDLRNKHQR